MTDDKILNLLLQKHSGDLCVPECKTDATWYNPKFHKFDLWVMRKSWTKPFTFGYEIKRSRSDFLRDTKWSEYLPYCSDFYFVAPPGIIQPEELPSEVGLLITSKNIARLYTKRKAIHRDVEIPESIFRYILMWRVQVVNEQTKGLSMQKYWQNWLAEKADKKELGHNVSKKIREVVEENIDKVTVENHRLQKENERLAEMKNFLKELGYNERYFSTYQAKDKLKAKVKEIETGIPDGLLIYLNNVIENLTLIKGKLTTEKTEEA